MSLNRLRWLALPVALALLAPAPADAAKKKAKRPAASAPASVAALRTALPSPLLRCAASVTTFSIRA